MKVYLMIVRHYPSIAISYYPPARSISGGFYNDEQKYPCFGLTRQDDNEMFDYLTNKYNIPDSYSGYIEVDL